MSDVVDLVAEQAPKRQPAPGTLGAVPLCRHYGRRRYDSVEEAAAAARRLPKEQRYHDPVVACASHYHIVANPQQ